MTMTLCGCIQKALVQQQQEPESSSSLSSSALAAVPAERRRSDPALHDMEMLNTSADTTYTTVTGISALRLANYQKVCFLMLRRTRNVKKIGQLKNCDALSTENLTPVQWRSFQNCFLHCHVHRSVSASFYFTMNVCVNGRVILYIK